MVKIELGNNPVTVELTADAAISDGEALYVSGSELVSPATDANIQKTLGAANEGVAQGEVVEVVVMGPKTVTADGPINPGEPVVPATTAGRVVSETALDLSHTHTMSTHSHTAFETSGADAAPGAHQPIADGAGTDLGMVAGVDASGQAAETASTDAVDPGDTNSTDPSPENARTFGMAVGSAGAAGDSIKVLVGVKSG